MNGIKEKYSSGVKLYLLAFGVAGYFLLALIAPAQNPSFILRFAKEITVFFITAMVIVNLFSMFERKQFSPLTLVISFLFFNIFFALYFQLSTGIFRLFGFEEKDPANQASVFFIILTFLVNIVTMLLSGSALLVFRELFFMKAKRRKETYYNTMLLFIAAACITAVLKTVDLGFISIAFTVTAAVLIFINSFRIGWITFLSKKEKHLLLLLSVLHLFFFIYNLVTLNSSGSDYFISDMFSGGTHRFLFLMFLNGIMYFGILFFTTLFHLPTAEAIDRKSKEINSLQNFSKLINRVLDMKELTETILSQALVIADASASWVVLRNNGKASVAAVNNIPIEDAVKITEHADRTVASEKFLSYAAIDLIQHSKSSYPDTKYFYAAITPLKTYNGSQGSLFVVNTHDERFDDQDKAALETFTDYAGIAVDNARLLHESIEKKRLEKEMDVARDMQQKLLPERVPNLSYLDISSVFVPAYEVGGDYYDFFELEDGKLGFTIADVSGKGISAAFLMAELRGIFCTLMNEQHSPKEVLVQSNRNLKRSLDRKSFVTATFGIFDVRRSSFLFSRAGNTPVLLQRGDTITEFQPRGLGLGLDYTPFFAEMLDEQEILLQKNDLLIMFTDGVNEAQNTENVLFGIDRLKRIILEQKGETPDTIAKTVMQEIAAFSEHRQQHDDITFVIFRWNLN